MTNKKLDDWFGGLDFIIMEKMIGLRQYDFSDEDGYQDFVDACENWWNNLDMEERKVIYKKWEE